MLGVPPGQPALHAPSPETNDTSPERFDGKFVDTIREALDVLARNQPVKIVVVEPKSPPKKRIRYRVPEPTPNIMIRPDPREATCAELKAWEDWWERQLTEKCRRERPFKAVFDKWGPPQVSSACIYSTGCTPSHSVEQQLKKTLDVVTDNVQ